MGPIGLHGGGEYLPGDERFLDALLETAAGRAAATEGESPLQVVILPTAAARGRPDLAGATGAAALERRAEARGVPAKIEVALVVDEASAADPGLAELLATADLVHLSGGDPDIAPALLAGSAAGAGLRQAWENGAVIGGASAGAMILAEWTWTPQGGIPGLGYVRGLAVVPHYDDIRRVAWQNRIEQVAPAGLGYLGLDERTGVISGNGDGVWQVAGQGAAYWFPAGSSAPVVARHGQWLSLPA
jgi:cyanophycinase-like exopeptidase